MPALASNSADAAGFKEGQQVKWFVNEKSISPYIGKVDKVDEGNNKVWVVWPTPVGGLQQHSPEDLILVTEESDGISPVKDKKEKKDKEKDASYGSVTPDVKRLAEKLAASESNVDVEIYKVNKMASGIAGKFATDIVEKFSSEVLECKNKGLTDVQAYQSVYASYEKICSDNFMRSAITQVYAFNNAPEVVEEREIKFKDVPVEDIKEVLPEIKKQLTRTNKPDPKTLKDYGYEE